MNANFFSTPEKPAQDVLDCPLIKVNIDICQQTTQLITKPHEDPDSLLQHVMLKLNLDVTI